MFMGPPYQLILGEQFQEEMIKLKKYAIEQRKIYMFLTVIYIKTQICMIKLQHGTHYQNHQKCYAHDAKGIAMNIICLMENAME